MPFVSAFSKRRAIPTPRTNRGIPVVRLDWRGLDLTSPYDVVKDNRSPYAKNFRIYNEVADTRRVAITSRKGAGEYLVPLSETLDQSNTSTTGAQNADVGILSAWKAMKFVAGVTGPLTKVELNLRSQITSAGPIIVRIHEDDGGVPGTLLADSGILGSATSGTYSYIPARFIEAPTVTNGETYWIVAYVQEDGESTYQWASNTASTLALTSDSLGLGWTATTYSLNFKTYVSSTARVKGITRYAPTNSNNTTILAIGDNIYTADDNTGALTSIVGSQNSNVNNVYFTYADDKAFWINGYNQLQTWNGTTVGTITHSQLPILKLGVFHKNRFFGISAADPNKLIFSEEPGNDDGAGNFWYNAYLSTSFIYIPSPKASDPITAIIPFQDSLYIFTRTKKYVLAGSDPGSFSVRQAMGSKGAVSQNAVYADENYIYFGADDGIYRFNGARDEIISDMIQTEYADIADLNDLFITKWKRIVRVFYPKSGQSSNSRSLLWHTTYEEWMMDTDVHVSMACPWTDGNDDNQLVEVSSKAPTAYFAEQNDHNLGKQIDFVYYCKYDSLENPALKKRIVKFFPLLEGDGSDYTVSVGVDKDRQNTTRYNDLDLSVGGALIGHFRIGDGTTLARIVEFQPTRIRISGYAYYWQVRVQHKAINNPVQFIGYVLSIRAKRL